MSELTVWPFNNGDDAFLAVGNDPDNLRVWQIDDGVLRETRSRFPGCLRFMPYADIGERQTGNWDDLISRHSVIRLHPDE